MSVPILNYYKKGPPFQKLIIAYFQNLHRNCSLEDFNSAWRHYKSLFTSKNFICMYLCISLDRGFELKNILNFGYGINLENEGMFSHTKKLFYLCYLRLWSEIIPGFDPYSFPQMCMDVSHSVFLYVNQIFSPTEPIFLEIRQAFASF